MASLNQRLGEARDSFTKAGIRPDEAALDAEVLARSVLGWDRAAVLTHGPDPTPADFDSRFHPLVARRAAREPVAYIVGHREFWGLEFEVNTDVLIPRPETEILVEEAITWARGHANCRRIIDVCTGSGCIAIALALEVLEAEIIATDSSAAALAVARRNALRHGVDSRITFMQTDLLEDLEEAAEVIVSNPPYVPHSDAEGLQPEVAVYEPAAALYGGEGDGLDVVRRLFAAAPKNLAGEGHLVIEFGFGQDEQVQEAARQAGWEITRVRNDLQGIPRVAVLRR
jgi:release factor glutamine methyltransferase